MTLKRIAIAIGAGVIAAAMSSMPAGAHSEIESTDPAAGAKVEKVPPEITLEMSEDPGQGSFIKATDGCGDRVPGDVEESGAELVFSTSGGSAGKWSVTYKAISAEDGHVTHGKFDFTVTGKADCTGGNKGDHVAGGEDTRVTNTEDEGSGFPIVPVVIGAAILVLLALMLRRSSSS